MLQPVRHELKGEKEMLQIHITHYFVFGVQRTQEQSAIELHAATTIKKPTENVSWMGIDQLFCSFFM